MRNKNGKIRKRTCAKCGTPTRNYRIVVHDVDEWSQQERNWFTIRVETPICTRCMPTVDIDFPLFIKSPELEIA